MRSAAAVVIAGIVVVISGCATRWAPPQHRWRVVTNSTQVPMQGFETMPRVLLEDGAVLLVNFVDEPDREVKVERALERVITRDRSRQTAALGAGAALCLALPLIYCAAAAADAAASRVTLSQLPRDQADRLAAMLSGSESNAVLQQLVSERLAGAAADFPRLMIRPATVILIPKDDWVTFWVIAEVQGWLAPSQNWAPSYHMTQLPWREPKQWSAQDLRNDMNAAVAVLANDVARVYLPYDKRGR